jgi:hypothetical protein
MGSLGLTCDQVKINFPVGIDIGIRADELGISRICFEMTNQATMPSSSEKCLRVSKTESYGLSRICFEMTRQATLFQTRIIIIHMCSLLIYIDCNATFLLIYFD